MEWRPERLVDVAQAQALIERQFPTLTPARLRAFGSGWDNTAFLVNDTWVFRFPRRTIAVELMVNETRVFSAVGKRLPLPVPLPEHVGEPSDEFPWPFAGYRMLPGRVASEAGPDEAARLRSAAILGSFLRAVHAIPFAEALEIGAPRDTMNRLGVAKRAPKVRERIRELEAAGMSGDLARRLEAITELEPRPLRDQCLLHGDLHASQLLVGDSGVVSAVIDWGDTHAGDPAVDFQVAHSFLPPAARPAFRDSYGPIDDATWRLGRFRALNTQVMLALSAADRGEPEVLKEARRALEWIAEGE